MQAFGHEGRSQKTHVLPSGKVVRIKVQTSGPFSKNLPELSEKTERFLEFVERKLEDFYRELAYAFKERGFNAYYDPVHPEDGVVVEVPKHREVDFEKTKDDVVMSLNKKWEEMLHEFERYARELGVNADVSDMSDETWRFGIVIVDDNGFGYALYYDVLEDYDKGKYIFAPVSRETYVVPIDPVDKETLMVLTIHFIFGHLDNDIHEYAVPIKSDGSIDFDNITEIRKITT